MTRTALVTVTYNCERHVAPFIRSLETQEGRDFLLVVVDNKSTDGTLATLEAQLAQASFKWTIIRNDRNVGVAAGNNIGIAAARTHGVTDWMLIINNDVTFDPTLVGALTQATPAKDIVSPLILDRDTDRIWYAGGHFDERRMLSTVHDGIGNSVADYPDHGRWETEYAPTTCLAIPLRAFDETDVGIFHEGYFCYYDDADWIYRARRLGYRLLVDGGEVLRHFEGGASGGNRSPFSLFYLTRNRLIFVRRARGYGAFAAAAAAMLVFVLGSARRESHPLAYLRHRLRGWAAGVASGMMPSRVHRSRFH